MGFLLGRGIGLAFVHSGKPTISFILVAGMGSFAMTGENVVFSSQRHATLAQGAFVMTGENMTPTLTAFHLTSDTFIASGTWTAPATIVSPTDVSNQVLVRCWGTGGGSTTNVGGAGGAAYADNPTYAVTPSTGYAVVIGAAAANADGGNTTFDTTGVVAAGGKSGTNGATGGTTAASTGTNKFAGGNGVLAVGGEKGGGAGGSAGAGSGSLPGDPDGGLGQTIAGNQVGRAPGGGAGSSNSAQSAGAGGMCRVTYKTPVATGFSRCIGRTYGRDSANATTRNITLPPGSGGRLVLYVVSDEVPTISMSGWTSLTQVSEATSQVSGCVFHIVSTGSEGVALATSSSQKVNWVCERWLTQAGGTPGAPEWTTASGNTTNPDPPNHTPSGGSANYVWKALCGIDGNSATGYQPSAIPANYGNYMLVSEQNTDGVRLALVDRFLAGSSENPASFTASTEQWIAATISIPPS